MIIPVRCFTCGKVLADKWEYYEQRRKQLEDAIPNVIHLDDLKSGKNDNVLATGKIMDELGLTRICCRRHVLGHVDLIDDI